MNNRSLIKIARITLRIICFLFLTLLTQVGGIVYLISLYVNSKLNRRFDKGAGRSLLKISTFLLLYFITSFLIVPVVAKPFGRAALPITKSENLRPCNFFTCILNRNYVEPKLLNTTIEVANRMNAEFPGTVINYLDAGFPFINGFPLFPHLSHNDGKKLDLSFCYIDKKTMLRTNEVPSFMGYGISEEPRANELNTPAECAKVNWQYSFMRKLVPQGNKNFFIFDSIRTRAMVNQFATEQAIGKIFIEPHLKIRLNLTSDKVRFHGCNAVRHDDHLHIQLK
jgi:hypothetical protein